MPKCKVQHIKTSVNNFFKNFLKIFKNLFKSFLLPFLPYVSMHIFDLDEKMGCSMQSVLWPHNITFIRKHVSFVSLIKKKDIMGKRTDTVQLAVRIEQNKVGTPFWHQSKTNLSEETT